MANYTGIQGQNILIVSSDPSNPIEGQIWYNSTSNTLKGYQFAAGAWATGGSLNNAIEDMAGNVGTQTAALAVAGYFAPSPTGGASNLTEEYDGTSWTSGGTQPNNFFRRTSCGTQTAALGWGGYVPSNPVPTRYNNGSNEYDGTSWTTGGGFPVGIQFAGGAGSQTAALSVAGNSPGTSFQSLVAKYDGTSWTTSTSVPQGLRDPVTIGTQTATLNVAGVTTDSPDNFATDAVNTFNGTTWTSSPVYPTTLWAGYGMGTQTNALVAAGVRNPSPGSPGTRTTNVNLWNGTTWTSQTATPTAKNSGQSAGTAASGLMAGGGGSPTSITLEWTGAALATRTITTS
jgi:hypothetical protein